MWVETEEEGEEANALSDGEAASVHSSDYVPSEALSNDSDGLDSNRESDAEEPPEQHAEEEDDANSELELEIEVESEEMRASQTDQLSSVQSRFWALKDSWTGHRCKQARSAAPLESEKSEELGIETIQRRILYHKRAPFSVSRGPLRALLRRAGIARCSNGVFAAASDTLHAFLRELVLDCLRCAQCAQRFTVTRPDVEAALRCRGVLLYGGSEQPADGAREERTHRLLCAARSVAWNAVQPGGRERGGEQRAGAATGFFAPDWTFRTVGGVMRPARFRPQTLALRSILRWQRHHGLAIPRHVFQRALREVVWASPAVTAQIVERIGVEAGAANMLHEAAEAYLVKLFETALMGAVHARSTLVLPADLDFARAVQVQCVRL